MPGRLESINISKGGVPKQSVFEALVTRAGLAGDQQEDQRYHGGPDRAAVLFSLELIHALQYEGHPIVVGSIGENLTVSGLDWRALDPGTDVQIGSVRLQITDFADPCSKIAGSFKSGNFRRVDQNEHPGWSRLCARVIDGGIVRPGDEVILRAPN
jgi:MOSC domain-containing protein YiiM